MYIFIFLWFLLLILHCFYITGRANDGGSAPAEMERTSAQVRWAPGKWEGTDNSEESAGLDGGGKQGDNT